MTNDSAFTPALGRSELTADYDRVIRVMTREKKWRPKLVEAVAPKPGETIIDLGSGTGSLAVMLATACPKAHIIALDPDPQVRAIAEAKAFAANVTVRFETALGGDSVGVLQSGLAHKVTVSLVLHQCQHDAKQALLANAFELLSPDGLLFVADYGVQRTLLMQLLFNQVRSLDGYESTRANKDGIVPILLSEAGFVSIAEPWTVQTPSGSISLWTGRKPQA